MANIGDNKKKRTAKVGNEVAIPVVAEITAPKCKVCQSPHRREIDACLAMGWSQVNVRKHFNQFIASSLEQFTKQNISTHAKKHLRSMDAAIRKIWEERARQMGLDIENAENFILTEEGVFDAIIYEGMQQVRQGNTSVEARDILQAVQQRDKRRESQNEIAVDAIMSEFKEYMKAGKEALEEYLTPGRVIDANSIDELQSLHFEKFAASMEQAQARITSHNINPPLELIAGEDIDDADFEEVEENGSSGSDGQ